MDWLVPLIFVLAMVLGWLSLRWLFLRYLARRSQIRSRPVSPPAPAPRDAGGELYQIAARLREFFAASAHPSDVLRHPDFERGVRLLAEPAWSVESLLGYYAGDNLIIACLALEALVRRKDPTDLRERRSEERRVGKECDRVCRSRWSPYH